MSNRSQRLLIEGLAFLLAGPLAASAGAKPPNVVMILVDDLGSIDLNCYGADDLTTPHLDGLAERGVRMTQFYAAAPVCSASRVGFLTGRYPVRAGQPANGPMRSEEVTIAERFAAADYDTGHVGKWHLGADPPRRPGGQGFRSSFGHMKGCIDNYSHFFYWNGPNRHDLWRDGVEVWENGEFFPDLMVRECKAFIDQQRDAPFLLYWALNAPHYPYQGSDKWRKHYADLPSPRAEYAAFVSTMDESIGQVLEHLKGRGLDRETIVVFQSDHGHSTETRAFGGGGSAGPYRGAKFSLFEGGIRVPAIISWPGTIPEGQQRGQLATGCDWLPTLADYCGVDVDGGELDGRSLRPIFEDPKADSPHETFQWQFGRGHGAQWAVRQGPWKLIGNPRDTSEPQRSRDGRGSDAKLFLANLDQDVSESTNLADEHPEVVERLQGRREALVEELSR